MHTIKFEQTHHSISQQHCQETITEINKEEEKGWFPLFSCSQGVYEARNWEYLQNPKVFILGFR
jgi:hypothetical protein